MPIREITSPSRKVKTPKSVLRVTIVDENKCAQIEQILRSVDVHTPVRSAEDLGRETEQTSAEADLAIAGLVASGSYIEHNLLNLTDVRFRQPFFYIDSTSSLRLISADRPATDIHRVKGIHLVKS